MSHDSDDDAAGNSAGNSAGQPVASPWWVFWRDKEGVVRRPSRVAEHRRGIVAVLVLPVLFFAAIALRLDSPVTASAIPCQGYTSQFSLTEQSVEVPPGDIRDTVGPSGIVTMRTYTLPGQSLDTVPLGLLTSKKITDTMRAVPLTDMGRATGDDAWVNQLRQVRNLAYAVRYDQALTEQILALTSRDGTIATWLASRTMMGLEDQGLKIDKPVADLAAAMVDRSSTGKYPFDDVGQGALAATATVDGQSLHVYIIATRVGYDKDEVVTGHPERPTSQAAKNQSIIVSYPGGEVRGKTTDNGDICIAVPWTTGKSLPQLRVTWQMQVPAGTLFMRKPIVAGMPFDEALDSSEMTLNAISIPVSTPVIWSAVS